MADTDVLSKSVTKNDYNDRERSGVLQFFISSYGGLGAMPSLPPFWSHERDLVLMATIYREPVWASAVWKYCSRQIARQWEIKSDVPLRAKKAQELFLDFDDGRGWVTGMFTHLQAYRLSGNGGWVEIVRASSARGSKIIGLVPLDPLRCTRTGNPAEPIFYRDLLGNFHWIKDYQVFNINDMPDTGQYFYKTGHCAAERAYHKILQMEGLERYLLEKLTGRRPTAIHIVNGLKLDKIEQAYQTAQESAQQKGLQSYMGIAIATVIDPSATLSLVTIPITEVPDGFNPEQERTESKLVYANCVGIPVQELDPRITAPRALSSMQDVKLEETVEGQNVWEKDWIHAVNKYVLDDHTTWYFPDLNLRDEKLRAEVTQTRASAYGTMVDKGIITPAQAAQMLVDEDEIYEEFLPAGDETSTEIVNDEEKVEIGNNVPTEVVDATPVDTLATDEATAQKESGDKKKVSLKSISGFGADFEVELSQLVTDVFNGDGTQAQLANGLRSLIRREAEAVYVEGMLESGEYDSESEAQAALTEEDSAAIETWISTQLGFVSEFAKAASDTLKVEAGEPRTLAQQAVLDRITLWRNSLEGLGQAGKMSALADVVGIWELGHAEEHCNEQGDTFGCVQLNGQAHHMSYYTKNNLNPGTPGSNTTCGGWECKCKIRSKKTGRVLIG